MGACLTPSGPNAAIKRVLIRWKEENTGMNTAKDVAVERAALSLGLAGESALAGLRQLWDAAYEQGKLDALDELTPRFCVCMK
jgi:hypothetical protein